MSNERAKIKATIFWCQNNKVNEMSGKYQMDLCNLSEKAVEALEGMGIEVKVGEDKKADQGSYITCKSSKPMKLFDTDGDEIFEEIGNGSKAVALISTYDWKYKNKSGVSPSIVKITVTDLVAYAASAPMSAEDEDVL
jgi:hypothetical protein